MDQTERKMMKIVRVLEKFTVQTLKENGIGTAELDFIHTVRHNPGITQADVRKQLNLDKGAAARRVVSLESKGYLIQKLDENDKRCRHLFATKQAQTLKNSKASIETIYFDWLLEELEENEKQQFIHTLNQLYSRSKTEYKQGFPTLQKRLKEGNHHE